MKKLLSIIIVLVLSTPLFAVTYVETTDTDENPVKIVNSTSPLISATLDLSSINVEDIGVYGRLDGQQDIVKLDSVSFLKPHDINGHFKTARFFIYWNVIASSEKLPKIILQVAGPLHSTSGSADMNYTLKWKRSSDTDFVGFLTSSDPHKSISGEIPLTSSTSVNDLVLTKDYLVLELETEEAYWTKPSSYYNSNLWIKIIHK